MNIINLFKKKCKHKWTPWSALVGEGEYPSSNNIFYQFRKCTSCNEVEHLKLNIGVGRKCHHKNINDALAM